MSDFENENVEQVVDPEINLIDELNMKHQAELDEANKKYAQLQRAYALKIGGAAETSAPAEKTEEELQTDYENTIRALHANKGSDLKQAEMLLEVRDYRLNHNMSDPFLPQDGTPSEDDINSAENQAALMRDAIDYADGSDGMYRAYIQEHLVDKIKITNRR